MYYLVNANSTFHSRYDKFYYHVLQYSPSTQGFYNVFADMHLKYVFILAWTAL